MTRTHVDFDRALVTAREARSPVVAADIVFAAAYVGTAFIRALAVPSWRIAWVDLLLVVAIVVGARHLRRSNPARVLAQRALPWLWLYVVANLIALLPLGLATWAVDQLARDVFGLVIFCSALAYFVDRPAARRLMSLVVPAMAVLVSVMTLVSDDGIREGGPFRNPNYAAHFILAALVCVVTGRYAVGFKAVVVGVGIAGVLATGSFASFVFGGAVVLYVVWSWSGRFSPQLKVVARILVVCMLPILVATGWSRFQEIESEGAVVGNVDTTRFEHSSSARMKIWSNALEVAYEHPLGIGNGGSRARPDVVPAVEGVGYAEVHNDYLAILLESGILGLIGIGGVLVHIWRAGWPGGPTRMLLFGVLATGFTREVINFRHAWVLLAFILATEWNEHGGRRGSPTVAVPAPGRLAAAHQG